MFKQRSICVFLLLFSSLNYAQLREIPCKVVGVSDGDTLTCLHHRTQLKVRLRYIDAPELAQPYGNRAKQALSALAFKKQVILKASGYDKYQRLLAVVLNGRGENINLRLVEQGMAWAYHQTEPLYQQAQRQAKAVKIGLWQDRNPINPTDWRASKGRSPPSNLQISSPNHPLVNNTTRMDCSIKRTCRQFNHYSQAERYFRQCGIKEMDGNNDGIPCNRLYRKAQKQ